jgi:hypothetical protein
MCLPLRDSSPPKEWRSQRCGYGIITRKKLLHFKRGGARRAEGIKLQKSKSKKLLRFLKRRCHEVTEEIIKQTTKPE